MAARDSEIFSHSSAAPSFPVEKIYEPRAANVFI